MTRASSVHSGDLNHDGVVDDGAKTVDDHGDLKVIGNSEPRFNFGLHLGADWKGIDVQMFFQGVLKRDLWLSGPMFWGADGGEWQSVGFEDYWRPENTTSIFGANPNAYYPKAYLGDKGNKNKLVQTGYLQNGAYVRMKNLQVGYTLPKAWTQKAHMEKIRLYFSAENLFTISGIADMFDPEAIASNGFSDGKTYPLSQTFSFGINVTL